MKRIYMLLLLFLLFTLTSCKRETYVLELEIKDEYQEYINIDTTYEVTKDRSFTLPKIENDTHIKYQYHLDEERYVIFKTEITYELIGWVDANHIVYTNEIEIKEDTILSLELETKSSTSSLILNLNGGKIDPSTLSPTFGNQYQVLEPIKDSSIFVGWYLNKELMGKKVEELNFELSNSYVLYAKYISDTTTVYNLIDQIPTELTFNDIETIEQIRTLYNNLPTNALNKITNYDKLLKAEEKIKSLKNILSIINSIDALPEENEVLAAVKYDTDKIYEAYNLLTDEEKLLVSNYNKLTDVANRAQDLYNRYSAISDIIDREILLIPSYSESYYKDDIETWYSIANGAEENIKSLLKLQDRINAMYERLQQLEQNQITYIVSNNTNGVLYASKQELFNAFFTDFYHYIVYYHGTEELEKNNINSLEDFLELASDPNGGGTTNMRGIGNIAGNYLLKKDVNGILANQPETTFFGFCNQNGLYQDLISFFTNFFAYWRLDEGYANLSNYGADIFAESWAPTVDIAKFFYYNEETSYVKSERMIDCLTNIASVVYGLDDSNILPQDLRLRGYQFDGWYLTADYSGSKITDLSTITDEKITLYAKWIIDEEQKDKDAAAMVDIYIYNLTTTVANINYTTISYVRQMYNNLSDYGKQLVTNYSILESLESQY